MVNILFNCFVFFGRFFFILLWLSLWSNNFSRSVEGTEFQDYTMFGVRVSFGCILVVLLHACIGEFLCYISASFFRLFFDTLSSLNSSILDSSSFLCLPFWMRSFLPSFLYGIYPPLIFLSFLSSPFLFFLSLHCTTEKQNRKTEEGNKTKKTIKMDFHFNERLLGSILKTEKIVCLKCVNSSVLLGINSPLTSVQFHSITCE